MGASGICYLYFLQQSLKNSILAGVEGVSESTSHAIFKFLDDSLKETQAVALALPVEALEKKDTAVIRDRLKSLLGIFPKFENGMFILDKNGHLWVDYPQNPVVMGTDFSYREYFQRTIKEGKGIIGVPYMSGRTGKPVLTFTAILRGSDNQLLGVLGCSVQMLSPDALGGIRQVKIGRSGYIYVFNTSRMMILHPENVRVLKPDIPLGANKLLDAAIKGFEGVGETVNSRGVPMLTAFKRILGTDWIVGAQQSQNEAFFPIARARQGLILGLILMVLFAALTVAMVIRRITNPLTKLRQAVMFLGKEESKESQRVTQELEGIKASDEIGDLANAFLDISKHLEKTLLSLKTADSDWKRTFDAVPDLISIIDKQYNILKINQAMADRLRINAQDVGGLKCYKLFHGTDEPIELCPHQRLLEDGQQHIEELVVESLNGTFLITTSPLNNQDGEFMGSVHVARDITERRQIKEALEASEFRYRSLVENIDLGVTLIGSDYKIIMTNASQGKIFGKTPQEFEGKYCFREFEKREGVCPHCPGAKTMASGEPMEVDTIGVHDDGTFHYAHVRTFPVFDSLGNISGFVEVVEDTTARRQAEEQLAWEGKVASSVAELSRALLASRSIENISQMVLDSAIALTDSSLGYCGYLDPQTGHFILPTFSREVLEDYKVPDKNIILKEFAGLGGYGLDHRQPVLINDLATDPRATGTPQGHIPIHNFVSVPAMIGGDFWGQVAVANSPRDYSANDQEVCERLALIYALSIQRQRAEEEVRQSEARFSDIADNVAEWVWETNVEGTFTHSSAVVEKLLGYKPEEVLGQHFFDFLFPEDREALKSAALAIIRAKQPFRDFISPTPHKNKEIVWLSISGVPVLDDEGNLLGYRGANIDITERRKSQEALENANIQLKALVQEVEKRNGTMALLNDMSEMLQTCQTSEEAFSTISHFVPKFFPTDAGGLYLLRNSKNLLSSVTTWGPSPPSEELFPPDDCWAVRSGRVHRVDDPASALLCKHIPVTGALAGGYLCVPLAAHGVSLGILHIRFLSCITQGREAEEVEAKQRLTIAIAENLALSLANLKLRETLQNQAIRDPLTGLYNRRYLEDTMDRELHRSRRLKAPLGVVMMDLDHFKDFNDNLGHGAGDALLSALPHVITAGIRTEDIACRYGGEEFLLVMPGSSLEATRERAENVRQAVKALQVKYQGLFLKSPTISLGVAIFPDHGGTAEEVIAAADAALYRAKEAGRDRVEIASLNSPAAAAP